MGVGAPWDGGRVISLNLVPEQDVIDHDGEDCVCGPRSEPCPRPDGSMSWVHIHHRLDQPRPAEPGGEVSG